MVILGLTWILGFFYFADGAEALAILFTIANSLQGVAIFIFHVILHEKARYSLLEALRNAQHTLLNLKVNGLHLCKYRMHLKSLLPNIPMRIS